MKQEPSWSRRGLLSAHGLAQSTGGFLAALLPEKVFSTADDDRCISQWTVSRRAMACDFTVFLHALVSQPLVSAQSALAEIDELEELLSVYRADSEVSRVNQRAAEGPVQVDGRLFRLLQRCAELYAQTDGAFDAATGRLIKTWGFFAGPRRVPDREELAAAMQMSGMRHVELDAEAQSVRYGVAGLEVNLGSIGKGYAIDRAIERMQRDHGVACALMTGGSSSLRGIGSPRGDDRGWLIGIEDPGDSRRHVATVCLKDRALGTSNTSNRFFEADGRRYGHLLDPRTGWPADEVASASVLAPDGATADALATAFFVVGLDKTAEFCHNHRDVAAVIVLKDSQRDQTERHVVTFNLSPHEVRIVPGEARLVSGPR